MQQDFQADARENHRPGQHISSSVQRWIDEAPAGIQQRRLTALIRASESFILFISPLGFTAADAHLMAEISGHNAEDITGWNWQILLHPDDRGPAKEAWQQAIAKREGVKLTLRFRLRTGKYHTYLMHGEPVFNDDGAVQEWVTTVRRATTIDSQTAPTGETSEIWPSLRIRAIHDALDVGISIYDTQGNLIDYNTVFPKILGSRFLDSEQERNDTMTRAALLNPRYLDGRPLPPEEWPSNLCLAGETERAADGIVIMITTFDKRALIVHVSARPIFYDDLSLAGTVNIMRDITETYTLLLDLQSSVETLKALGHETARRNGELEKIFANTTEGIILYNADGSINLMNEAARREFPIADINPSIPLPLDEHAQTEIFWDADGNFLPHDRWPINRLLRGEILTGSNMVEIQSRNRWGNMRHWHISGTPIFTDAQQVTGYVIVARDITQQHHYKIEAETMARVISHELRTPLTSAILLTELMKRRYSQQDQKLAELTGRLDQSLHHMNLLIDEVVSATRLEIGKMPLNPQESDLFALTRTVVENMRAQIERSIVLSLPDTPGGVLCDPQRITQVIQNLLINAAKYSPPDTTVTITGAFDKETIRISVADQGTGIALEQQAHIFERFYRSPDATVYDGGKASLGLGLYICAKIIELHNGTIGVNSLPDVGSTFWFCLNRFPQIPD